MTAALSALHAPRELKALASAMLRDPRVTPDHLLLLADALDEAANAVDLDAADPPTPSAASIRDLANALRAVAPIHTS